MTVLDSHSVLLIWVSDRDGGKPQTFTILYKQVGADEFIVYASNISDAGSEQTNRYRDTFTRRSSICV